MAQSSNNNAIINTSSLINHGNSIAHTSSQHFWDRSVSAIEKGLKDICSGNVNHPTPGCTDMKNCTQCLLLSSLSAVSAAFTADAGSLNTGNHGGMWIESAADMLSPHTTSVLSQSHSDDNNIPGCLKVISKTSTSGVPQRITDLLMKCLVSQNKFISYLAKKTLLSGIQYQHIKVSDVMRLIKAEQASSRDHSSLSVAVIELLKDLMSRRLFQNGNTTEIMFEFMKDFDYGYLLENKIDADIDRCLFSDTDGLDVHLSLVHKVVKHVMCRLEKCNQQNLNFICTVIQHAVIPHTEAVFSISSNNGGYLICLKHLKSISALLDLRFLEDKDALPSCVVQVCEKLLEKMPNILLQAEAGGLLRPRNFIGTTPVSQQQHSHSHGATSVLTRQIITVTLKACAFMTKGDKSYHMAVASSLESFWRRIGHMISGPDDTANHDWLPLVFGDQDDQWIAALFCLLVVYKELEYGPYGRDHSQHGGNRPSFNNEENVDVHELLQTICPHKLFLQLTRFIDHDHLVLTDFLISPETSFLTYFTQYLHLVCNNWTNFSSCLTLSSEDKFLKADSTGIDSSSRTAEKQCMSNCDTVSENTSQNSEASPGLHKTETKPYTNNRADVHHTSTVFDGDDMASSTSVPTQLFSKGQIYSNHTDRNDNVSWSKGDLPSSSLVSYSDSESDNSLDEQEKVTCKGRQNQKRFRSSNSDVDDCISVKHFHHNSSDSSGECEHENTNTVNEFGQGFSNHHNTENRLELTMDMFIRLRLHIERLAESDLFPYNAKPLLHLLEACEAMYENAEQEII